MHQAGCAACTEDTDGALIVMTYQCLRAGPPSVIEKLDKGETVDPERYYFRMTPLFEASAPRYDWINRIVAIGVDQRLPDGRSIASLRFSDDPFGTTGIPTG